MGRKFFSRCGVCGGGCGLGSTWELRVDAGDEEVGGIVKS